MTTAPVTGLRTQRFLLHPESAYGVAEAVIATRYNALAVQVTPNPNVEAFAPQGYALPTLGVPTDDTTTLAFSGKLSFTDLCPVYAGILGPATITNPGGAAHQWFWSWDGAAVLDAQSYSLVYGDSALAYRIAGALFNGLSYSVARDGNLQMTAAGFGKQIEPGQVIYPRGTVYTLTITATGGTYDVTWDGDTASGIAYNAVAATIASDINTAAGATVVAVTGTGPWTITGTTDADVTATIATGSLTGGSATLTKTQAGGAVTSVPAVPMFPLMFDVFMDDAWADLGNTQIGSIYQADLAFGERWARARPIAADQSFDGYTEAAGDATGQNHTANFVFAANADGVAKLTEAQAGTKSFFRIEANGAADSIDAGHAYLYRTDFCHLITGIGQFGAVQGGVHSIPVNGRLAADDVSGNAIEVTIENGLPSLTGA